MRDIALHILDLVQNAIEAGARRVALAVTEDSAADTLTVTVADDGKGMSAAMLARVRDPFFTTRTTRRAGLGLPLLDMTTRQAGGHLDINSQPGRGTTVQAVFQLSHLDRPPLGPLAETITGIVVANPTLDFTFSHCRDGRSYTLATREITAALGDIPLSHPQVLTWLHGYLSSQRAILYGGARHEDD